MFFDTTNQSFSEVFSVYNVRQLRRARYNFASLVPLSAVERSHRSCLRTYGINLRNVAHAHIAAGRLEERPGPVREEVLHGVHQFYVNADTLALSITFARSIFLVCMEGNVVLHQFPSESKPADTTTDDHRIRCYIDDIFLI